MANKEFNIIGIPPDQASARALALDALMEKAMTHKILLLGYELSVWGKCKLHRSFRHSQIRQACGMGIKEDDKSPLPKFGAPVISYAPKSGLDEAENVFEWRRIISHACHLPIA